jgi:hypothetical protein
MQIPRSASDSACQIGSRSTTEGFDYPQLHSSKLFFMLGHFTHTRVATLYSAQLASLYTNAALTWDLVCQPRGQPHKECPRAALGHHAAASRPERCHTLPQALRCHACAVRLHVRLHNIKRHAHQHLRRQISRLVVEGRGLIVHAAVMFALECKATAWQAPQLHTQLVLQLHLDPQTQMRG